jgi:hypothetical protein
MRMVSIWWELSLKKRLYNKLDCDLSSLAEQN